MSDFERIFTINVTSMVCALVVVVALMIAVSNRTSTRKRLLLFRAMMFHTIAISARLASWFLVRRPGSLVHVLIVGSVTAADAFSILTCLGVMVYIYTDTMERSFDDLGINRIIVSLWVLNGLNMVLALTNPWTHVYNYIDQANIYQVGKVYWLRNLLFLVQGILMVPVVIGLQKRNGASMTRRLLACGSIAIISTLCELIRPGLSLFFPAVSLMLVLLVVSVQARMEGELAKARAEAAESRLRLLSGQINRHFVFNSLTAIKAFVAEDPALAEQTIQDFSDYLRSHLDVMADSRLVPFTDELERVRHYVALEMADCTVPLEVRYELKTTDFQVPPLTVQPLVENAIRHGIQTREEGGTVVVSTREHDDEIEVCVSDDGRGFSSATARQDERRRVGIANVRERIEKQCGGMLTVQSDASGTVALMTIPKGQDLELSHS